MTNVERAFRYGWTIGFSSEPGPPPKRIVGPSRLPRYGQAELDAFRRGWIAGQAGDRSEYRTVLYEEVGRIGNKETTMPRGDGTGPLGRGPMTGRRGGYYGRGLGRRNPRAVEHDPVSVRELTLFAENTYELYNQFNSIIDNIKRKMKRGVYDPARAPRLWQYWFDAARKRYQQEFGARVPAQVARDAAAKYAPLMEESIREGEYGPITESTLRPGERLRNPPESWHRQQGAKWNRMMEAAAPGSRTHTYYHGARDAEVQALDWHLARPKGSVKNPSHRDEKLARALLMVVNAARYQNESDFSAWKRVPVKNVEFIGGLADANPSPFASRIKRILSSGKTMKEGWNRATAVDIGSILTDARRILYARPIQTNPPLWWHEARRHQYDWDSKYGPRAGRGRARHMVEAQDEALDWYKVRPEYVDNPKWGEVDGNVYTTVLLSRMHDVYIPDTVIAKTDAEAIRKVREFSTRTWTHIPVALYLSGLGKDAYHRAVDTLDRATGALPPEFTLIKAFSPADLPSPTPSVRRKIGALMKRKQKRNPLMMVINPRGQVLREYTGLDPEWMRTLRKLSLSLQKAIKKYKDFHGTLPRRIDTHKFEVGEGHTFLVGIGQKPEKEETYQPMNRKSSKYPDTFVHKRKHHPQMATDVKGKTVIHLPDKSFRIEKRRGDDQAWMRG